jgi:hypothetical protein
MLSRREVLAGGVVGGLAGAPDGSEEQQADREGQRQIERAINSVDSTVRAAFPPINANPVSTLRKVFETFVKSHGKFPDFCDIGLGVFYDIYDWHIRNRQQIIVIRQQDNRYTIQFMFTTLMVRFENEPNYVGVPYDKI